MKAFIALIVAVLLIGGGYYWYSHEAPGDASQDAPEDAMGEMTMPEGMDMTAGADASADDAASTTQDETPAAEESGPVKEFTVSGKNFSFTPSAISVNKGDRVKITFVDTQGFHDFSIEGYNIATNQLQGGQSDTLEFVADKAGSFEFYCSVGNHRQMGMKGTLTVQ